MKVNHKNKVSSFSSYSYERVTLEEIAEKNHIPVLPVRKQRPRGRDNLSKIAQESGIEICPRC